MFKTWVVPAGSISVYKSLVDGPYLSISGPKQFHTKSYIKFISKYFCLYRIPQSLTLRRLVFTKYQWGLSWLMAHFCARVGVGRVSGSPCHSRSCSGVPLGQGKIRTPGVVRDSCVSSWHHFVVTGAARRCSSRGDCKG